MQDFSQLTSLDLQKWRPFQAQARALQDVLRLQHVDLRIDTTDRRKLKLAPEWLPLAGEGRVQINPDILSSAIELASDYREEQTRVLLRPPLDEADTFLLPEGPRAIELGAKLWTWCVESALEQPSLSTVTGVLAGILGHPVHPDATIVRVFGPSARVEKGYDYAALLEFGIPPQSRDVRPTPLVIPDARGEHSGEFRGNLDASADAIFLELELVLLESVVAECRFYAEKARGEEGAALLEQGGRTWRT